MNKNIDISINCTKNCFFIKYEEKYRHIYNFLKKDSLVNMSKNIDTHINFKKNYNTILI